jgi:hypothetical protein
VSPAATDDALADPALVDMVRRLPSVMREACTVKGSFAVVCVLKSACRQIDELDDATVQAALLTDDSALRRQAHQWREAVFAQMDSWSGSPLPRCCCAHVCCRSDALEIVSLAAGMATRVSWRECVLNALRNHRAFFASVCDAVRSLTPTEAEDLARSLAAALARFPRLATSSDALARATAAGDVPGPAPEADAEPAAAARPAGRSIGARRLQRCVTAVMLVQPQVLRRVR